MGVIDVGYCLRQFRLQLAKFRHTDTHIMHFGIRIITQLTHLTNQIFHDIEELQLK
ncbi:hypothetical protein D3C79_1090050 [compost metagenome]